jgi:diacylglycerol kinase family enzyme
LLRYAAALLRGRLSALPDVRVVRGRTATLAADRNAPVEADGEIVGHLPVTIRIADRPLPFLGAPAPIGT